jgi:hypothetical protein
LPCNFPFARDPDRIGGTAEHKSTSGHRGARWAQLPEIASSGGGKARKGRIVPALFAFVFT